MSVDPAGVHESIAREFGASDSNRVLFDHRDNIYLVVECISCMQIRTGVIVAVLVLAAVSIGPTSTAVAAQERGGDSMEVKITVTEDGDIDTVEMVWEMSDDRYEMLQNAAASNGYDSVAEWHADDSIDQVDGYLDYSNAEDRALDDGYAVEVHYAEIDTEKLERTEITADDHSVSVELADVDDPADDDSFDEVTYVLDMPYEITDSNAQTVDGSVATWHLHEEASDTITVESETDDSMPGFGPVAAVVGLVAGAAVRLRTRGE